jgi:hypothetical protein
MLAKLEQDGCLYQDNVVDHLVKSAANPLLRENTGGNLVLAIGVLKAFRDLTETTVVWVRSDFY